MFVPAASLYSSFALVSMTTLIVGAVISTIVKHVQGIDTVEVKQAITLLLEQGVSVEFGKWHLYRSNRSNQYIILNFNERGDPLNESEESFDQPSDAVAKFIQRAKL